MKAVIGILALLVIASATSNVLLWRRVAALQQDVRIYQSMLEHTGRSVGSYQAAQDFASGKPRWYQTGGFGVPVPPNRPGRQLAMTGCCVTEYDRAFVETYNKRMDELFAQKSGGGDGKGYPDGPANEIQPIRSDTNRTSSAAGSRR